MLGRAFLRNSCGAPFSRVEFGESGLGWTESVELIYVLEDFSKRLLRILVNWA